MHICERSYLPRNTRFQVSNISEKFNGPKPIDLNWRIVLKNVLFYEYVRSYCFFVQRTRGRRYSQRGCQRLLQGESFVTMIQTILLCYASLVLYITPSHNCNDNALLIICIILHHVLYPTRLYSSF